MVGLVLVLTSFKRETRVTQLQSMTPEVVVTGSLGRGLVAFDVKQGDPPYTSSFLTVVGDGTLEMYPTLPTHYMGIKLLSTTELLLAANVNETQTGPAVAFEWPTGRTRVVAEAKADAHDVQMHRGELWRLSGNALEADGTPRIFDAPEFRFGSVNHWQIFGDNRALVSDKDSSRFALFNASGLEWIAAGAFRGQHNVEFTGSEYVLFDNGCLKPGCDRGRSRLLTLNESFHEVWEYEVPFTPNFGDHDKTPLGTVGSYWTDDRAVVFMLDSWRIDIVGGSLPWKIYAVELFYPGPLVEALSCTTFRTAAAFKVHEPAPFVFSHNASAVVTIVDDAAWPAHWGWTTPLHVPPASSVRVWSRGHGESQLQLPACV